MTDDDQDGGEALLDDTGTRGSVTGINLIRRQSAAAAKRGYQTTWGKLAEPKNMPGIGKGTQCVDKEATVTGAVAEGALITYTASVLEDEQHGANVPGLLGLDPLAQRNTYVGSHNGCLVMIPSGTDKIIKWPSGTKNTSL